MQTHPTFTALSPASKPFLKWAGGKQRLLAEIRDLLPPGKRLIEPFLGAGSVFLGTDYSHYILGDANPDLMTVWTALQSRPREFMDDAEKLFSAENWSSEGYYRIRDEFNQSVDRYERAVRFIYLNKFGFNGVYRVNSRGVLNTPYGHPKVMPAFPRPALEAASRKLHRATLHCGGFRFALEQAEEDDVVYCDPPYSDVGVSSFTKYTASGFGQVLHEELCRHAREAAARGAHIIVSNHDNPYTRSLYGGWEVHELEVTRSVARSAGSRTKAAELLATLRPSGSDFLSRPSPKPDACPSTEVASRSQ